MTGIGSNGAQISLGFSFQIFRGVARLCFSSVGLVRTIYPLQVIIYPPNSEQFPRNQILMEVFRLWNKSVSKWIQDESGVAIGRAGSISVK